MIAPPDSIKMVAKDSLAKSDSLALADKWGFSYYYNSIGDIIKSVIWVLIICGLIVALVYLLVCIIRSCSNKPSKFWASLPPQDWFVFLILITCRDNYLKKSEIVMNIRAEEKRFNNILESRLFSKRDSNRARELLEDRKRAYRFFKAEHFDADDYRQWVLEYETEGVEIERIISKLPAPLNNKKTAKLFAILINNQILDEDCLPPMENSKQKGYYYTIAEVIWEQSNLTRKASREKTFAKLWAENSLWKEKTQEVVENEIKMGINASKPETKREIEKMLEG